MLKGVSEKEYSIIREILKDYNAEFFAYGSRTRGDFSALSDLDIMLKCNNYDKIISELKEKFDKSALPYVVSFVDFNTMDKNFYSLIQNDLVKIQ